MALFFAGGMMLASWGVHIPTVKDKFALNDLQLSVALFAVAIGSIGAMLVAGPWIIRAGIRNACTLGGIGLCASGAAILLAPAWALLLPVLLLFGFGGAVLDVAMNAEATAVETAYGRPIMSSLHGMFSLGGMVGAAVGGIALTHGMRPQMHLALASLFALGLVLAARPALSARLPATVHPAAARRAGHRILVALGLVALVAMIAEGAMYDWSTVYMRETLGTGHGAASAAYAVFSAGMAAGRFGGDAVRGRLGNARVVWGGGLLACAGMLAALLMPWPAVALCGFTLVGLGLSNLIPVMFIAAAQSTDRHAAESIASVAGLAYAGMLVGPVLIGAVAHASSLPIGLTLVALCAAVVAGVGPRVVRAQHARSRAGAAFGAGRSRLDY